MVQAVADGPVPQEGVLLRGDAQVGDALVPPHIQGPHDKGPPRQPLNDGGVEGELGLLVGGGVPLHVEHLGAEKTDPLPSLLQYPRHLQLGGDVGVHLHGPAVGGGGGPLAEPLQALPLPLFFLLVLPVAAGGFLVRRRKDLPGLGVQQHRLPLFQPGKDPRRSDDTGDAHGPGQDHAVGGEPSLFQDDSLQLAMPQFHHLGGGQVPGHGDDGGGGDRRLFPAGERPEQPLFDIADIRHPFVEVRVIQGGQLLPVKPGVTRHGVFAVDPLPLDDASDPAHIVIVLQQQQLEVQYLRLVRGRAPAQFFDQGGQLPGTQSRGCPQPPEFLAGVLHVARADICLPLQEQAGRREGHTANRNCTFHTRPPNLLSIATLVFSVVLVYHAQVFA